MALRKAHKEAFARFFEQPSREALRDLLKQNSGESEFLDFKEEWLNHSTLAKHIIGFANTGNACMIVGVKEEDDKALNPVGLTSITDKADIINGLKKFLPQNLLDRVDVLDFSFDASEYPRLVGKRFQVLLIDYDPDHIPMLSLRDGEGIKNTVVYVRRMGGVAEATHDEIQNIINRRIETRYSTSKEINLKQHLEQLRILYAELPRSTVSRMLGFFAFGREGGDYDEFVRRMVEAKKMIIQSNIGASPEFMQAFDLLHPPKPVARPASG
jgi:hypothetical protein